MGLVSGADLSQGQIIQEGSSPSALCPPHVGRSLPLAPEGSLGRILSATGENAASFMQTGSDCVSCSGNCLVGGEVCALP